MMFVEFAHGVAARIPVSSQRFAAVPCDTSPTLRVEKSDKSLSLKVFMGARGEPHNLKVVGSGARPILGEVFGSSSLVRFRSNPVPTTKYINKTRELNVECFARA